MSRFIRASLFLAGLEIFLALDTTLAVAQLDPTKVLMGRWEGGIEAPFKGRSERTLIIRSVEPTETGWVATGGFFVQVGVMGGPIRKGIDVSIQDGLIVLQFNAPGNDPVRLVLAGDNRLEGTIYFAQYRATGIYNHTYRLSLEKKAGPKRAPRE